MFVELMGDGVLSSDLEKTTALATARWLQECLFSLQFLSDQNGRRHVGRLANVARCNGAPMLAARWKAVMDEVAHVQAVRVLWFEDDMCDLYVPLDVRWLSLRLLLARLALILPTGPTKHPSAVVLLDAARPHLRLRVPWTTFNCRVVSVLRGDVVVIELLDPNTDASALLGAIPNAPTEVLCGSRILVRLAGIRCAERTVDSGYRAIARMRELTRQGPVQVHCLGTAPGDIRLNNNPQVCDHEQLAHMIGIVEAEGVDLAAALLTAGVATIDLVTEEVVLFGAPSNLRGLFAASEVPPQVEPERKHIFSAFDFYCTPEQFLDVLSTSDRAGCGAIIVTPLAMHERREVSCAAVVVTCEVELPMAMLTAAAWRAGLLGEFAFAPHPGWDDPMLAGRHPLTPGSHLRVMFHDRKDKRATDAVPEIAACRCSSLDELLSTPRPTNFVRLEPAQHYTWTPGYWIVSCRAIYPFVQKGPVTHTKYFFVAEKVEEVNGVSPTADSSDDLTCSSDDSMDNLGEELDASDPNTLTDEEQSTVAHVYVDFTYESSSAHHCPSREFFERHMLHNNTVTVHQATVKRCSDDNRFMGFGGELRVPGTTSGCGSVVLRESQKDVCPGAERCCGWFGDAILSLSPRQLFSTNVGHHKTVVGNDRTAALGSWAHIDAAFQLAPMPRFPWWCCTPSNRWFSPPVRFPSNTSSSVVADEVAMAKLMALIGATAPQRVDQPLSDNAAPTRESIVTTLWIDITAGEEAKGISLSAGPRPSAEWPAKDSSRAKLKAASAIIAKLARESLLAPVQHSGFQVLGGVHFPFPPSSVASRQVYAPGPGLVCIGTPTHNQCVEGPGVLAISAVPHRLRRGLTPHGFKPSSLGRASRDTIFQRLNRIYSSPRVLVEYFKACLRDDSGSWTSPSGGELLVFCNDVQPTHVFLQLRRALLFWIRTTWDLSAFEGAAGDDFERAFSSHIAAAALRCVRQLTADVSPGRYVMRAHSSADGRVTMRLFDGGLTVGDGVAFMTQGRTPTAEVCYSWNDVISVI